MSLKKSENTFSPHLEQIGTSPSLGGNEGGSKKLIRTSTIPTSIYSFCKGLLPKLKEEGYEVVVVSSPGEQLQAIAERDGVRTIAVPMERRIAPLKDLRSLWQMWRVLRRERPDMVHSITPKAGLVTMVAGWLARVPVRIHMFTGLVFPTSKGLKRLLLMATDWLTCACATHVIPEGEGVKADLLNHHITRKPIAVLGHGSVKGIDLRYFNCEEPPSPPKSPLKRGTSYSGSKTELPPLQGGLGGAPQGFHFVFIGRLVGDKGMNELVGAFKRLHDEFAETELTLVGAYEEDIDPVLPETRAEIERNPGIHAVGHQSDVRPYYMAADALVFPSYREGFPNVVIEAGAMGLPSIVTDINGSREIIIDGKNGVIVPPRDEEALYGAMRHWVTHRDEVARMAAEARPLVESRYEQGYVHQCLIDFYKQCLKNK